MAGMASGIGAQVAAGAQAGVQPHKTVDLGHLHALERQLRAALIGRDTEVRGLLVAALSKQNVLLLGPPGTAKSMLTRLLAKAFGGPYFELLFSRFTQPEEVFGPLSIKRMIDEEVYVRNTSRYLPAARLAFADEALALTTPLLTTKGWKTVGTVQVGDYVYGLDGQPTEVLGLTDVATDHPCYEVTFHDGHRMVTDGGHKWLCRPAQPRGTPGSWRVCTTAELLPTEYDLPTVTPPIGQLLMGYQGIMATRPVPSVPVRCLTVAAENHLFLAGENLVATHNCFKANSAILNALLTIINEREYDNGGERVKVPLEFLVGASNELPQDGALAALYDRFLLRYWVDPVPEDQADRLLTMDEPTITMRVANLTELQEATTRVELPAVVRRTMIDIRTALKTAATPVLLGDRRFRASRRLVQANALLNKRLVATPTDCAILAYSYWETPADRTAVAAAVGNAIRLSSRP